MVLFCVVRGGEGKLVFLSITLKFVVRLLLSFCMQWFLFYGKKLFSKLIMREYGVTDGIRTTAWTENTFWLEERMT